MVSRAARLCHGVAYGGQIAVPLDVAQQFVQHCTGAPAAFTEQSLASSPDTPPQAQEPPALVHMYSNPLCDPSRPLPRGGAEGGSRLARPRLALRLSRLSSLPIPAMQSPGWGQGAMTDNPLAGGASGAGVCSGQPCSSVRR